MAQKNKDKRTSVSQVATTTLSLLIHHRIGHLWGCVAARSFVKERLTLALFRTHRATAQPHVTLACVLDCAYGYLQGALVFPPRQQAKPLATCQDVAHNQSCLTTPLPALLLAHKARLSPQAG